MWWLNRAEAKPAVTETTFWTRPLNGRLRVSPSLAGNSSEIRPRLFQFISGHDGGEPSLVPA